MSFVRSFIAIDLAEETKAKIGLFEDRLRNLSHPVHWESQENFHINLLFLGDTRTATLGLISAALKSEIKKRPFELVPGHLDYLYKKHGDSIIYVSVEGEVKKLKELRDQVCRCVERVTKYDAPSRFLPHITICRIKPYIGQQEKKNILSDIIKYQPKRFAPFVVGEVRLMQTNNLDDAGHRYATVTKVTFGS